MAFTPQTYLFNHPSPEAFGDQRIIIMILFTISWTMTINNLFLEPVMTVMTLYKICLRRLVTMVAIVIPKRKKTVHQKLMLLYGIVREARRNTISAVFPNSSWKGLSSFSDVLFSQRITTIFLGSASVEALTPIPDLKSPGKRAAHLLNITNRSSLSVQAQISVEWKNVSNIRNAIFSPCQLQVPWNPWKVVVFFCSWV